MVALAVFGNLVCYNLLWHIGGLRIFVYPQFTPDYAGKVGNAGLSCPNTQFGRRCIVAS